MTEHVFPSVAVSDDVSTEAPLYPYLGLSYLVASSFVCMIRYLSKSIYISLSTAVFESIFCVVSLSEDVPLF